MPRKSPYVIDLSEQERKVLQAQARRYTLPYRDVVRAKIVLMAQALLRRAPRWAAGAAPAGTAKRVSP